MVIFLTMIEMNCKNIVFFFVQCRKKKDYVTQSDANNA